MKKSHVLVCNLFLFHVPIVNSDYQSLARWPAFFQAAWAPLTMLVTIVGWIPERNPTFDECLCWEPRHLHPTDYCGKENFSYLAQGIAAKI